MSDHTYNPNPEHQAWCADCWNAAEKATRIANQLAKERAHSRLMRATDEIVQTTTVWTQFEQDLEDSDCFAIAGLFAE